MIHMPNDIQGLALSFPGKVCIEDFNCSIPYGSRIALVGRNGSSKSSLLLRLRDGLTAGAPEIRHARDIVCAHVPQILDAFQGISGGESLNAALGLALAAAPNVLLLDEPSNQSVSQQSRSPGAGCIAVRRRKARLCMARIGAMTPRLIILDEPANNLDLETRTHLVQVLQA